MRILIAILLLLLAAPAWAVPIIVLTGGTIDIVGVFQRAVTLSGPGLTFSGVLSQDFTANMFVPGEFRTMDLNGWLVGTLTLEDQVFQTFNCDIQRLEFSCASIMSVTPRITVPLGGGSVTVPFELTGRIDTSLGPLGPIVHAADFTGSGLLTAAAPFSVHYEITAVPEPATWLLLASGLGMLLWYRQRAQAQQ